MALSDRSIREQTAEGRIVVDDDDTQPASVDLHLNRCFLNRNQDETRIKGG